MADDGKLSLFSAGSAPKPGGGKEALFSGSSGGPIKIDCARCAQTSVVGVFDALARLARFSFWIPGRTYSHRLTCPACHRRSWTRLRFL